MPPPSRLKPRLQPLSAAFALCNALRLCAYLPTLWAVRGSGHAESYSLLTWLVFMSCNVVTALWLYTNNGRQVNQAIAVSAVNALMCAAIAGSMVWIRWIA